MINEEPIHKEMSSNKKLRHLRILDKVIVTLMLAILIVLSLPVLNSYHAPKSARTAPQMRSVPSNHQIPTANHLIIV